MDITSWTSTRHWLAIARIKMGDMEQGEVGHILLERSHVNVHSARAGYQTRWYDTVQFDTV